MVTVTLPAARYVPQLVAFDPGKSNVSNVLLTAANACRADANRHTTHSRLAAAILYLLIKFTSSVTRLRKLGKHIICLLFIIVTPHVKLMPKYRARHDAPLHDQM